MFKIGCTQSRKESYMNIKINAAELAQILEATPCEQNIMLVGKHGIGKSQILNAYFTAKGQKVVMLFLGQMSDPGDIIGLPRICENGSTDFAPPYWFPRDGKPIVLFLDELNRARPEILQTVMDLTLNRTLAGKKLPAGSRIISAVNEGGEYQLTDLDPALVSRFNIYRFEPTVREWLLWAQKIENFDRRVIDFISANPAMLDNNTEDAEQGLTKTADRRAWHRVSNSIAHIKTLEQIHKILISGIVGMQCANDFFIFLGNRTQLTAREILLTEFNKTQKILKNYTTNDFAVINDSLFIFLEAQQYEQKDKPDIIENLRLYFAFLIEHNFREAAAHFASAYSSSQYPKTLLFIVTECPVLHKEITAFIQSI